MKIDNLLANALTEAFRGIEEHPDSIQDIINESLERWETGLRINHRYEFEADENIFGQGGYQATILGQKAKLK